MIDKEAINDYLIKLTGKAAIPEPLEIDDNYKVLIQGSITEKKEKNREDGGRVFTYIFEPVLVEIIDNLGKTLKAKDVRGDSKLWRAQMYAKWKEGNYEMTDEGFYHLVNAWLRRNADEIVERVMREL